MGAWALRFAPVPTLPYCAPWAWSRMSVAICHLTSGPFCPFDFPAWPYYVLECASSAKCPWINCIVNCFGKTQASEEVKEDKAPRVPWNSENTRTVRAFWGHIGAMWGEGRVLLKPSVYLSTWKKLHPHPTWGPSPTTITPSTERG